MSDFFSSLSQYDDDAKKKMNLWNENRNQWSSQINDYANQFQINSNRDNQPDPMPNQEPAAISLQGLGYHSLPSDIALDDSTLVIPVDLDVSHEEPFSSKFTFALGGKNKSNMDYINKEIFEPGHFLRKAIEQMYYFPLDHHYMPTQWLEESAFEGRYVHPAILKERQSLTETEPLEDNYYCKWSELWRAHMLSEHSEEIGDNIDEFLLRQKGKTSFSIIDHLKEQTEQCEHLPVIWTVLNARSPTSLPETYKIFLSDFDITGIIYYQAMLRLIQSRYLVNLCMYSLESRRISSVIRKTGFTKEELQVPPFVITVPSSGDIFVLTETNGDIFSLYDSAESLELGAKVGKAFRRMLAKHADKKPLKPLQPVMAHGLVSQEIGDMIGEPRNFTRTSVGLEILLHMLISHNLDLNSKFEFSKMLTRVLHLYSKLPDISIKYRERCVWAITRGELGHETEDMKRFNEKRGLQNVPRSSWNFKLRNIVTSEYVAKGSVSKEAVLELLNDFHPSDAISFSKYTVIHKEQFEGMIKAPLCGKGTYTVVSDARVSALNTAYSDNGGPRLYTQGELDYMMSNVKGVKQRRRLTSRLLRGGIVFCFLIYYVTEEAKERNKRVESHACLCKLYLEAPSPEGQEIKNRHLVVEWLEGVFDNKYKLCAVPILTYLSLYFGVQVKQREYSRYATLEIVRAEGPCVPTALYAANERMRKLVETQNRYDWEPYTLTLGEGRDYVFELACSLLFYQRADKSDQKRIQENRRPIFKDARID